MVAAAGPASVRRAVSFSTGSDERNLDPHARRPVEQTAPIAERRPVCDGSAFTAPREVPTT
jgi:hypothetical protein